jgi:hypothetical protein
MQHPVLWPVPRVTDDGPLDVFSDTAVRREVFDVPLQRLITVPWSWQVEEVDVYDINEPLYMEVFPQLATHLEGLPPPLTDPFPPTHVRSPSDWPTACSNGRRPRTIHAHDIPGRYVSGAACLMTISHLLQGSPGQGRA